MPRGVRWLLPDAALLFSFVTAVYCLFAFDAVQKLFRDSDTGWHIRTGEAILETGSLPRADPYSFTRHGQPWFAWEWGTDILMGLAHRWAGLSGVAALYAAAIAACTWLWFRLTWAAGGDFLLACGFLSPMLSTANLHWHARPHVLSWLFLLAAVWMAEKAPTRVQWKHLLAVGAFTAVWANIHASFFFGALIALIYAAAEVVSRFLWPGRASRVLVYLMAAAASMAGSLLNPYGVTLHGHIARYLLDHELLSRVGEYQSFNYHVEGATQILITLGLAALGSILALNQRKIAHFLLGAMLIVMALRSARVLPVVALLVLPLANGAIADALRSTGRRMVTAILDYSARLRAIDVRLNGAAAIPVMALLCFAAMQSPAIAARTEFPPDEFPVAAATELAKLPAGARVLAPDKYGGYLIYRFGGGRKVFMDGRSDFYGTEFMKEYIRLIQVRPGWRKLLKDYGFTHALVPVDFPLADALEHMGWKRLYADSTAVLLSGT